MKRAIVIGAGPAGTATGLALQRAGWQPEIFEAYEHSAGLQQGAFLTVAVNGLDALAAIGADHVVRALGFSTGRIDFASGTGKELGSLPIGPTLRDGTTARTIKRADLYAALRDLALARQIPIHHRKKLVGVKGGSTDQVTATFDDGTHHSAELLVGADGLRSTVRRLIDSAAPAPKPTGLGNAGGTASGIEIDMPANAYRMVWGKRCFFGFTVAPDGEIWWFANPPLERGIPDRDEIASLLADDAGPARQIVLATEEPLLVGEQLELPLVPRWQEGRMVLVGDAAHAVNPSTGQGVSLAWEDAAILAHSLLDNASVANALANYEERRRARVERVVKWGRRSGNAKAAGPVGRRIRDLMFPIFVRFGSSQGAQRRQAWLHEHHVPALPGEPAVSD
jgi:FAD-dependent urate hydroxylase